MSDFQIQLKKKAETVRLTEVERRDLRAEVVSYMEYHPRMERVAAKKAEAYIKTQPFRYIPLPSRTFQMFAGAFALMIFVVVPTLAERAMPGDVLYPMKVNFNEEVRSSLTFSPSEKIAWETERMERRISEVRLLATAGKLTQEVEEEAVEAVKVHVAAAQEGINKLRETDADEAAIAEVAFGTVLEVQTAVFDTASLATASTEAGVVESDELAAVVRETYSTVEANKASTTPSYEKLVAHLERETTRAYELSMSLKDSSTPEEQAEIERRLQDIDRKIEVGNNRHEAEGAGSEELIEATEAAQKLISFMTDIDVRSALALETLVPVELTDEEKIAQIDATLAKIDETTAVVNELNSSSTATVAPEIMEKVDFGIVKLEELKASIISMRDERRYDEAMIGSAEAGALARDINMLISNKTEPTEETIVVEGEGEEATTTEEVIEQNTSEENTPTNTTE